MLCNEKRKSLLSVAALACVICAALTGCETVPRRTVVRETVIEQATTAPTVASGTRVIREYDVVAAPPPPPVVEVVPPAPSPVAVWVGGYWRPEPHWVWVRGRWR